MQGLGDERKTRHLIVNHCYKNFGGKVRDDYFCLQETFIETPGKLPYLWRGNFHLTPGRGNSQGCLTLLSGHLNKIEAKDVGNRAHGTSTSYIVVNIYAPNPNNEEKNEFFKNIFEIESDL